MYEETFGEIPQGLYVLHKCDVPSCVNPDHLFLGTSSDNTRDMHAKGRGRSKLSPEQVKEIRLSNKTTKELVLETGMSKSMIQYIRSGYSWSYL